MTGQISANPLNYEAEASHMYALTVTVSDAGSPSVLTTTCSVTVNVRVSYNNVSNVTHLIRVLTSLSGLQ